MHKHRMIICAVAAIGISGTFMPWVTVPIKGTITGTAGDGWVTLFLFMVAALANLSGDRTRPLQISSVAVGGLMSLLAAYMGYSKIVGFNEMIHKSGDEVIIKVLAASTSVGPGLYVICAAGIALPLVAVALYLSSKSPAPTETEDV